MTVTAKLNFLRIAPRKVRLVADLIRGKKAEESQTILNFTIKKASLPLLKVLNQAIANAKNNFQMEVSNLFISKITIDEGPKYKRWRARAFGRAYEIQKKTSHITIVLDEIKKKAKKAKKEKAKSIKGKKVEQKSETKMKLEEKTEEKAEEKIIKFKEPDYRPEKKVVKPKIEKGLKRIFRRKAF